MASGGHSTLALASAVSAGVLAGSVLAYCCASQRAAKQHVEAPSRPLAAAPAAKAPATRTGAPVQAAVAPPPAVVGQAPKIEHYTFGDFSSEAELQQLEGVVELVDGLVAARRRAGEKGEKTNPALDRLPDLLREWRAGIMQKSWVKAREPIWEEASNELTTLLMCDEDDDRNLRAMATAGRPIPELAIAAQALERVIRSGGTAKAGGCCGGSGKSGGCCGGGSAASLRQWLRLQERSQQRRGGCLGLGGGLHVGRGLAGPPRPSRRRGVPPHAGRQPLLDRGARAFQGGDLPHRGRSPGETPERAVARTTRRQLRRRLRWQLPNPVSVQRHGGLPQKL